MHFDHASRPLPLQEKAQRSRNSQRLGSVPTAEAETDDLCVLYLCIGNTSATQERRRVEVVDGLPLALCGRIVQKAVPGGAKVWRRQPA